MLIKTICMQTLMHHQVIALLFVCDVRSWLFVLNFYYYLLQLLLLHTIICVACIPPPFNTINMENDGCVNCANCVDNINSMCSVEIISIANYYSLSTTTITIITTTQQQQQQADWSDQCVMCRQVYYTIPSLFIEWLLQCCWYVWFRPRHILRWRER